MTAYPPKQIAPLDEEIAEEWIRDVPDPDRAALGVSATKRRDDVPWRWQVFVSAMEFVREEPLESQLRRAIGDALRGLARVLQAEEEDREVWVIRGEPTGEQLVAAVAAALDARADEIRAHIASLS